MNLTEAVEAEIHDFMVYNATHTVPSLKLAGFGHKHGLFDARTINDLVQKARVSVSRNKIKAEIHKRMIKGIFISTFDLAQIGQDNNLTNADDLNKLLREVKISLLENAA